MDYQIRTILERFRSEKVPLYKIEKELGLSNGVLSKALKTGGISKRNFELVLGYYNDRFGDTKENPTIPNKQQNSLSPTEDSLESMKNAIQKINHDYGEGTAMFLCETQSSKTEVVSTGSILLDRALGVGGLPVGRIIEIYGQESGGKTTLAISVIAEAQKRGGICAFIDAEHAFDLEYAKNIGVNVDNLLISQPDYGEQALEEVDRLVLTGAFSVIVVDSVAALTPKGELEGEMGDSKVGLQARLMSQACRKLVASVSKTKTILIFINQLREKIGVFYGSPYVVPGGNALKFYSSVRLDVSRVGNIMNGDVQIGIKTRVKVVKNKVAPPFKVLEFDIIFGKGIDKVGELIDVLCQENIITKSGSWYNYNGNTLGQGKESVKQILIDNPALLNEIKNKLNHE